MTDVIGFAQQSAASMFAPLDRRRFLALSATASLVAGLSPAAKAQHAERSVVASGWSAADIPSQAGRIVLITGGNGAPKTVPAGTFPPPGVYSGLGFQQARALAGKGADVIIASRNAEKAAEAIAVIKAEHPAAKIRFEPFDLADLASVQALADRLKSQLDRIDVLVNNAGTAGTNDRRVNGAGQELVWATNTLGHFSLTAQLLPLLRKGSNPRIVFMSSGSARRSTGFEDLQTTKDYTPMKAYIVSKAALLIVARDLHRRSAGAGWGVHVTAVQPGTAKTFIMPNGPGPDSDVARSIINNPDMFRPTEVAVLSTLYAAAHPAAKSGAYYGPVNEQYEVGISEDHVKRFDTPEVAAHLYGELTRMAGRGIG